MNPEMILLLVIISAVEVAQSSVPTRSRSETCLCSGKPLKIIKATRIQAVTIFAKSVLCLRVEILVTDRKTGKKLCLDPNAKQGKKILQKLRKSA
ncbi:permeability factor 2 [Arapaima gigas]